MKRKSDNLAAAFDLAQDLVQKICRCGHSDDEHLIPFKKSCGEKGCGCRMFTPAPFVVEQLK